VLSYYLVFCATTAIMAVFSLYNEVLLELDSGKAENIIKNKNLSRVVFFLLALIAAPIVIFAVIFPSVKERFIGAMSEELNKD
jgi:undecaprenyl pyrophosphate phosphatase UppP